MLRQGFRTPPARRSVVRDRKSGVADVASAGDEPAAAGWSVPPPAGRVVPRESLLCVVLIAVTCTALALRLALPGQLGTPFGRWALYVVSLQGLFGALWEVTEGFVWQRRRSYLGGTVLLVVAWLLYVVAGLSATE